MVLVDKEKRVNKESCEATGPGKGQVGGGGFPPDTQPAVCSRPAAHFYEHRNCRR